jgi:hypothetical protein
MLLPDTLEQAQRSLEALVSNTPNYIAHEVVVAACGANDEVRALLDSLGGDVRILEFSPGTDLVGVMRRAASACSSAVVVFVEGGATVSEGWLDPLLRTLELEPHAGAVAGRKVVMGAAPLAVRNRIGAVAIRREHVVAITDGGGAPVTRYADGVVALFRELHARRLAVSQQPRSSVVASHGA